MDDSVPAVVPVSPYINARIEFDARYRPSRRLLSTCSHSSGQSDEVPSEVDCTGVRSSSGLTYSVNDGLRYTLVS